MQHRRTFAAKALGYLSLSAVFAFAMAGAALLDLQQEHRIHLFDILTKLIIIVGICAYASLCGTPINTPGSKCFTRWMPVALLPAFANLLSGFCIPDWYPGTVEVINQTAAILTTAAWEELYFRYVGRTLFERDGKYTTGAVVLLSLAFSVPHLINIFFYDPASVLLQVLSASVSGVFFLALYRHTGSLRLTILAHFLQNFIGMFFQTFTTAETYAQNANWVWGLIVLLAANIAELVVGICILKQHDYIAK